MKFMKSVKQMDKKFLNKVVDHIVSETRIGRNKKEISFPFSTFPSHPPFFFLSFGSQSSIFSNHCKNIYGLNDDDEIDYVWDGYKRIILDKIKNG